MARRPPPTSPLLLVLVLVLVLLLLLLVEVVLLVLLSTVLGVGCDARAWQVCGLERFVVWGEDGQSMGACCSRWCCWGSWRWWLVPLLPAPIEVGPNERGVALYDETFDADADADAVLCVGCARAVGVGVGVGLDVAGAGGRFRARTPLVVAVALEHSAPGGSCACVGATCSLRMLAYCAGKLNGSDVRAPGAGAGAGRLAVWLWLLLPPLLLAAKCTAAAAAVAVALVVVVVVVAVVVVVVVGAAAGVESYVVRAVAHVAASRASGIFTFARLARSSEY